MLGLPRMRRTDRLEAHATMVYLALLLWSDGEWRLRQKFPEETMAGAVRTLGDVYGVRLGTTGRTRDRATVLPDEQKGLTDALGGLPYLPRPQLQGNMGSRVSRASQPSVRRPGAASRLDRNGSPASPAYPRDRRPQAQAASLACETRCPPDP